MTVNIRGDVFNMSTSAQQDFTISGFGTPKAAILICNGSFAAGGQGGGRGLGIGMTDGTNQFLCGTGDRPSIGTTNTAKYHTSSHCLGFCNSNATAMQVLGDFNSFITDGIRIDFTNTPGVATFDLIGIFFNGADLSAHCGSFTSAASGGGTTDVTGVGFEPDVVFVTGVFEPSFTNVTLNAELMMSVGVWVNDGSDTQRSICIGSEDNVGTSDTAARLETTYVNFFIDGFGTTQGGISIGSADSDGFTATTVTAGNVVYSYLALNFGGRASVHLDNFDSPTSTGVVSYEDPGFTPQFIFMGSSVCEFAGTTTDAALTYSIGFADTDGGEFAMGSQSEDNVGTTDTGNSGDARIVDVRDQGNSATDFLLANLDSFDSLGYNLNWTLVDTTGYEQYVLAISEPTEAAALLEREYPRGATRGVLRGVV